jgi:hypothetical protein
VLRDRNAKGQDARVVAGVDPLEVEVVAEDQLPTEDASGALGSEHVVTLLRPRALDCHGEHVALDVEVERGRVDARNIERDDEVVAVAPGVHGHRRGPRPGAKVS